MQQEHRAADLLVEGLAGSQTTDWLAAANASHAVGGHGTERTLVRVWAGRDGWATLALVIDCHTRELLGWHLSRRGKASTASSVLEHALIARLGTLGRVPKPFRRRSDNGLVFTSRDYTVLVRSYGLRQEFIMSHCPQQNGMVERVIRTFKEQCVHRQCCQTLQHASRLIADWIHFYDHRRPTRR